MVSQIAKMVDLVSNIGSFSDASGAIKAMISIVYILVNQKVQLWRKSSISRSKNNKIIILLI